MHIRITKTGVARPGGGRLFEAGEIVDVAAIPHASVQHLLDGGFAEVCSETGDELGPEEVANDLEELTTRVEEAEKKLGEAAKDLERIQGELDAATARAEEAEKKLGEAPDAAEFETYKRSAQCFERLLGSYDDDQIISLAKILGVKKPETARDAVIAQIKAL